MEKILNFAETNLLESLLLVFVLAILVSLLVYLVVLTKVKRKQYQLGRDSLAETLQVKEQQINSHHRKNCELKVFKEKMQQQILRLSNTEATLLERLEQYKKLASNSEYLQHELNKQQKHNIELKSNLAAQLQKTREQQEFVKNAETTLKDQFHRLSEKVLSEKSEKFTEQNQKNIDQLLKPMKQQFSDFQKSVQDLNIKGSTQHKIMQTEIEQLRKSNLNISQQALDLTNALKAESKTQGNWGEMILHRVLETSGLQQGREYEIEQSFTNKDSQRYRPDVIIHLPKNKKMIIDAKVSLLDYEKYINSPNAEKALHLKNHINSMRTHIKQLSDKKYHKIEDIQTLDFVLMFVPVEAAYLEALNADSSLFEEAYKKNILLLSTSNLLATLKTIAVLWQNEDQNNNAIEIARQAGALYDKFVGFTEDLANIKTRLDQADQAWHQAENKLKTGRGNLITKTQTLKKLGARTSKILKEDHQER
ncbi:DNA recombination protein RmuC [hydrothermal vent metagenome]|uniref:DNA recombination protein RmuC n=2 Tax=hydrothermal vent metagenome TaxID=652676 RepID=A0A3B0VFU5_9ZZZZ